MAVFSEIERYFERNVDLHVLFIFDNVQRIDMEARASQLSTQKRRQKDQMAKDLKECLEYHDELHVVADHNISFDLDDGVVKNYAEFENILSKLK